MKNDKLHVIDKDGDFLHQVIYDGIKMPRAVCIDENDRVFVGEWDSDAIKVIALNVSVSNRSILYKSCTIY